MSGSRSNSNAIYSDHIDLDVGSFFLRKRKETFAFLYIEKEELKLQSSRGTGNEQCKEINVHPKTGA